MQSRPRCRSPRVSFSTCSPLTTRALLAAGVGAVVCCTVRCSVLALLRRVRACRCVPGFCLQDTGYGPRIRSITRGFLTAMQSCGMAVRGDVRHTGSAILVRHSRPSDGPSTTGEVQVAAHGRRRCLILYEPRCYPAHLRGPMASQYPRMPTFGVPCPTVMLTIGFLHCTVDPLDTPV